MNMCFDFFAARANKHACLTERDARSSVNMYTVMRVQYSREILLHRPSIKRTCSCHHTTTRSLLLTTTSSTSVALTGLLVLIK